MENRNFMNGYSKPETDQAKAAEVIKLLYESISQVVQSERAMTIFLNRFYRGGMQYDLPPAILETLMDCKNVLEETSSEICTQMEVLSDVYEVNCNGAS